MALETQRLLDEGVASILRLGGSERDVSGDDGRSAFQKLHKGVSRAGSSDENKAMLAELPEKPRVLAFIADFCVHVKMYRNQAQSVVVALLALPEWEDAARSDPELPARLCAIGPKVQAVFAGEVTPLAAKVAPSTPAAKATPSTSPTDGAVDKAAGYPASGATAGAAAKEPADKTEPRKEQTPPASDAQALPLTAFHPDEQPRVRLPCDAEEDGIDGATPTRQTSMRAPGAAPAPEDAAAVQTRQMLRSAFEAMIKVNFQADGGRRGVEGAMSAFYALQKAVNRAHWEHARCRRSGEASEVTTQHSGLPPSVSSVVSVDSNDPEAVVRVAGAAGNGVHGFLVELASGERRGRFLEEDGAELDIKDDAALKRRGAVWHELKRGEFLVQATGRSSNHRCCLVAELHLETSAHSNIDFVGSGAALQPFSFRNQRGIVDVVFCDGTVMGVGGPSAEPDSIASALEGLEWEPRRTLMFLFNLGKMRAIYQRRIHALAQMLIQVSPGFCEAARADEFLHSWIGACPRPDEPAKVVSYGFISSLRWAVFDAAWHHVKTRMGDKEKAKRELWLWKQNERDLKESMEFPSDFLGKILEAVAAAAQHCAQKRFPPPEEKKGVFGSLLGALTGAQDDEGPQKDEFHRHFADLGCMDNMVPDLLADLQWMIWNMSWYVANNAKGYKKDGLDALVRAERHFQRAFRPEAQWRGVNLGGWFLLEPGPCDTLWGSLPAAAQATKCEWTCCEALGPSAAARLLEEHRKSYFGQEDFMEMREAGLSHVRLPFGYWCVTGPRKGEPYVGPCLDLLDKALDQIEAAGLRVVLDLHGAVGGESAEPPCGYGNSRWRPRSWDPGASLDVLKTVAERYAGRVSVCGIGVCNEPSESLASRDLAKFYEDAVSTIRQAGMRAGDVAVLLPIFTERRKDEFLKLWEKNYAKYEDVVWDVHLYQCFGLCWTMLTLERHMQGALDRAALLQSLPACCVSEWSLAFPEEIIQGFSEERRKEALARFGANQLHSYECATHGWFFWTWKDKHGMAWNLRDSLKAGLLTVPGGGRASSLVTP